LRSCAEFASLARDTVAYHQIKTQSKLDNIQVTRLLVELKYQRRMLSSGKRRKELTRLWRGHRDRWDGCWEKAYEVVVLPETGGADEAVDRLGPR
jgi:hypothetical protein